MWLNISLSLANCKSVNKRATLQILLVQIHFSSIINKSGISKYPIIFEELCNLLKYHIYSKLSLDLYLIREPLAYI